MSKHTKGPFDIIPNTDTVDISAKCLGLSVTRKSIPTDVMDHIKTNRGLHIQVRHNGDKQAFVQATELSRLIAAAPEMLEALKRCLHDDAGDLEPETVHLAMEAIAKAEGRE